MSTTERIKVFTPYGKMAGSSRVRVFDWLEHTKIEADVSTFTEANRAGFAQLRNDLGAALMRHRKLVQTAVDVQDVVFIQREISPFTDGTQEARLLRAGRRGIVDLDDGLQWDWGQGGFARSLRPKATKILRMVRAADVVIAGNDLIAEWAAPYASEVVVIPSCVEPAHYARKVSYELADPPALGWIGSSSTEQQLDFVAADLLAENSRSGAVVHLVGDASQRLDRLEHIVERHQWTEVVAAESAQTWDAGLMPLRDGLFERAKCAYKILQYGAAGLPTLASHVGVNAEVVNTPPFSAHALRDLLEASAAERQTIGNELRQRVIDRYSFEAWESTWLTTVVGRV